MTNFEYYKKEIEGTGIESTYKYFNGITEENVSEHDVIAWLYGEYSGPLLTKDEKEYLHKISEALNIKINYICKRDSAWENHMEYLRIGYHTVTRDDSIILPEYRAGEKFKMLELDKLYTREELDLYDY